MPSVLPPICPGSHLPCLSFQNCALMHSHLTRTLHHFHTHATHFLTASPRSFLPCPNTSCPTPHIRCPYTPCPQISWPPPLAPPPSVTMHPTTLPPRHSVLTCTHLLSVLLGSYLQPCKQHVSAACMLACTVDPLEPCVYRPADLVQAYPVWLGTA